MNRRAAEVGMGGHGQSSVKTQVQLQKKSLDCRDYEKKLKIVTRLKSQRPWRDPTRSYCSKGPVSFPGNSNLLKNARTLGLPQELWSWR